jgi:diguanylate cyclase (GGDEF)-like protein
MSGKRRRATLPRIGLLGRFSLLSLAATVLLGVVLGQMLDGQIRKRAVDHASESAAIAARFGVLPQISWTDLRDGLGGDQIAALDSLLVEGYQTGSVASVQVWNSKGRLVYATDHKLIGRRDVIDGGFRDALAGRTVTEVVHALNDRPTRETLIETYTPLRFGPTTGRADGVFEIYTPYAPVAADIRHDTRSLYLVLGLGLFIFYAALFPIVLGASRRLRRQSEENRHQARHDSLTGLPNRAWFYEQTDRLIGSPRPPESTAVLVMDLDRFKEVNDTLGHHSGDVLLQTASSRIRHAVRDSDVVARLGGDEFAVLLPGAGRMAAEQIAQRVRHALSQRFNVAGATVDIDASIGIALHPEHAADVEALLQRADLAMYKAKEKRTGVTFYSPEFDQGHPSRLSLLGELRQAIDNEELILHYQPKAALHSGEVTQVEALVRWQRPEHGLVPPGDFIPLAESTGLIKQMSAYVLDTALRQLRGWLDAGLDLTVAVNLSARNLLEGDLPEHVADLLLRRGVPAGRLILEITESTIMEDPQHALAVLTRLSEMGVRLAIDDFGVGYSSLSYLKQLPVDEIKIDRSFVAHMDSEEGDAFIVRSTIDLGRNLGMHVVAEGVETETVWDELTALGCDYAQGWYLGKPMPAAELSAWLSDAAQVERTG